jgi:transcriptional regulator with PAS, ATPase and Fis domain
VRYEGSCDSLGTSLEALVNNPFEGIMAIDAEGGIFFINDFLLECFKRSREEVVGQKVWDLVPGCRLFETVGQGYSIWGETLRIGTRDLLVARFPLKNGSQTMGAMVKTIFPDAAVAKEIALKLSHAGVARQEAAGPSLCTCRDIIGETPAMLYVKKLARRASRTSSTLLITGESGTGKEIVAQAIHTRSVRREAPFISVNCGAIPENLLESELFGYVDGAFTGAKKGGKPGKFELANGGTILLDEIGDMPLAMQVKLLRVLQERAVWRIGAMAPTMLDVRVMASTNRDLRQLVEDQTFRQDLYYRLNVLEIPLPPLRERLEDLPMLAETLIQRINARIGSDATGIKPESLEVLKGHQWPGNVRELENLLEQAVNWSEEPLIDVRNIPARRQPQPAQVAAQPFRNAVEETERGLIISALSRTQGNKAQAARALNMQRSVLYKKLERFNIV